MMASASYLLRLEPPQPWPSTCSLCILLLAFLLVNIHIIIIAFLRVLRDGTSPTPVSPPLPQSRVSGRRRYHYYSLGFDVQAPNLHYHPPHHHHLPRNRENGKHPACSTSCPCRRRLVDHVLAGTLSSPRQNRLRGWFLFAARGSWGPVSAGTLSSPRQNRLRGWFSSAARGSWGASRRRRRRTPRHAWRSSIAASLRFLCHLLWSRLTLRRARGAGYRFEAAPHGGLSWSFIVKD